MQFNQCAGSLADLEVCRVGPGGTHRSGVGIVRRSGQLRDDYIQGKFSYPGLFHILKSQVKGVSI